MRGQKYWEEKVPLYTEIKEVREQRKQKYIKEAKQYYNILDNTSDEEYNRLKKEIANGNECARKEMMERLINPIISALAAIYAKYDIEEIVPFEDGLSYSLEMFNKRLKGFKKFPRLWSEFSISTINFYVFNAVTLYYQSMKYDARNVEYLPEQSLAWEIDKREHEEFSYHEIVKNDVRKRIIDIMARLETRQARVLALKYGFYDGCERTFEEISRLENVSRGRAEQLVTQSLRHIRKSKNNRTIRMYRDADLDLYN